MEDNDDDDGDDDDSGDEVEARKIFQSTDPNIDPDLFLTGEYPDGPEHLGHNLTIVAPQGYEAPSSPVATDVHNLLVDINNESDSESDDGIDYFDM